MKSKEETTPPVDTEEAAAVAVIAEAAGQSTDPDNDFYAELLELQQLASTDRAFADDRELFETETAEQTGVWRPCPWRKGAEILIAHQTLAIEKRERLEVKFRELHHIPLGQPLAGKGREAVWRESFYGTVIRDWRGFVLDGQAVPFTAENLRRYMNIRRFRQFVLAESNNAETFRADREKALRGNS